MYYVCVYSCRNSYVYFGRATDRAVPTVPHYFFLSTSTSPVAFNRSYWHYDWDTRLKSIATSPSAKASGEKLNELAALRQVDESSSKTIL